MTFDPQSESLNFIQQKKKKSVVRSVTRDVIFLPEKFKNIPTKSVKESLSKQGRVKSLSFRRTMTPQQIKATINRGFSTIQSRNIKFLLATRDNKLTDSADMNGDDICAKRGAVYVYQEVC